jgi:integrase
MQRSEAKEKTAQDMVREANAKLDTSNTMREFYVRLRGLRGNGKNKTLISYRWILLKFFRNLGLEPDTWLQDVKEDKRSAENDFNACLQSLSEGKVSDRTLKIMRAAFVRFAKELKLDELNILPVGSETDKRDVTEFNKEDVKAIVNATRTPRDRAILLLASNSGLRIGEISGLKARDVGEILSRKEEPYAVKVPKDIAKGKRDYVSFVTEEAAEALRDYLRQEKIGAEDRLFPGTQRIEIIFHHCVKRAQLEGDRVFHSLRKYLKTTLVYEAHVGESIADRIIGHKLGSMSQTYDAPGMEKLREEYSKGLPYLWLFSRSNGSGLRVVKLEEKLKKIEEENARLRKEVAEYSGSVKDRLDSLEKMRDELKVLVKKKKA